MHEADFFLLRTTRCFERNVVLLIGDGYGKEERYFSYFPLSVWWLYHLLAVVKTQKSHVQLFRIFHPGKSTFGSCFWQGSRKNFSDVMVFWIPNKKRGLNLSRFVAVMVRFGEIPSRPSDPSSSHPRKNAFLCPQAVSLPLNWIY